MSVLTRRGFLQSASATLATGAALLHAPRALASPFGLPIGLQLYSVRELLPKDYTGTLKQIAALGFTEVEAAGFFKHTPKEVGAALKEAGLTCPSAHYSYNDLSRDLDKTIAFHQELGVPTIICSFPGFKDPSRLKGMDYKKIVTAFTLDDWRWNADQFNQLGAKIKAAGLSFGYHNHTMEFQSQQGVVPFDELLKLTDPDLVTIELDCGWVMVGGGSAVDYLLRYPRRITMLHVKDFKKTDKPATVVDPPPAADLGTGTADYHPIFAAAKKANIHHYFVEQEEFYEPPMVSLKIDADYMKAFQA
jgi:sugar phosphate isomerase/epimerase